MTRNRLAEAASPYLLQHKDNPVHWQPWGPDALAEARRDHKPIILSVGYAACHWCHVMAHESFEDAATAAVMNRLFVNIKVDREERPDIDQIYMAALHALGEQGGWPLTMFLTPDGEPIWGGTYFPKEARYGRPGFVPLIEEVARLFREEPDKLEQNRAALMARLAEPPAGQTIPLDRRLLNQAAERLAGLMDPVHGGIRGAPKFPQASLLEFLWRSGLRTGDATPRNLVLTTLINIAQGGITDHLGGGFARYSVDDRWLVPHFEKMLYDNAQLIELMAYAAVGGHPSPEFTQPPPLIPAHAGTQPVAGPPHPTLDPRLRGDEGRGDWPLSERIGEAIDWLHREMTVAGGAFAASIDADSEGHEGKFYVWSLAEIIDVLGEEEGAFFATIYDATLAGNFEGKTILNRLAASDRRSPAEEVRLTADRARLLSRRETRVRPATDDKALADWNGLTIAALALAGATFNRPQWIALAERAFAFVTATMTRSDRLAHSWRDGRSVFPGLATDYAAMIKAAIALHQATLDDAWISEAERSAAALRAHHWDDQSPGYFLSADDAEALIIRPRSATDEATPSANSLMAQNLIRLWRLTGKDAYRADADAIIAAAGPRIAENLFAAVGMLSALDLRLAAIDVAIVAPEGVSPDPLIAVVHARWTPNIILSLHSGAITLAEEHPASGKAAVDGKATAYVCRGETCSLPVTEPDALTALLRG